MVYTQVILIAMKRMAMVQCSTKMVMYIKVNGRMVLDLAKVNIRAKVDTIIEVNG